MKQENEIEHFFWFIGAHAHNTPANNMPPHPFFSYVSIGEDNSDQSVSHDADAAVHRKIKPTVPA